MLPMLELDTSDEAKDRSFEAFYVWTQRLGLFPRVDDRLVDAADGRSIIVLINPRVHFEPEELHLIGHHLQRGGGLLVLDSIRNHDSTANEVLRPLDLRLVVKPGVATASRVARESGEVAGHVESPYLAIEGGTPVMRDTSRGERIVFARRHVGEGVVGVFVDSSTFSTRRMGGIFAPREDEQELDAFAMERLIFEELTSHRSCSEDCRRRERLLHPPEKRH